MCTHHAPVNGRTRRNAAAAKIRAAPPRRRVRRLEHARSAPCSLAAYRVSYSEMCGMRASGAAASWAVERTRTSTTTRTAPPSRVPALFDSRFDGDKLDALKHLLALISPRSE
ncbi:hypothetical protein VPH35_011178 [Triticum aestivum]